LLLKDFEIKLTSFWDLAGMGGRIFSMLTEEGLLITLMFLAIIGCVFAVNLATIFLLREVELLLAYSVF